VGDSITFTDTSTAGSGTINQWSWSFGDGGTSTSRNPTHSYSASGQETVSLTVTDSNSKTSTTTQTVQVNSVTPSPTPTPTATPAPVLDHFTVTASGGGNIGPQTVNTAFSITITAIDQNGNPYTSYTGTNGLTVSSGSINPTTTTGGFTNGVWTGSVTLSQAGTSISISTSGGGKNGQSNTFTVNSYKLVFTAAGAPQTIAVNQISGAITVQSQTGSGSAHNPGGSGISVTLTSSSIGGTFYSNSGGTTAITQITIAAGSSSSAGFYYKDTVQGTPTLTATATTTGYTPAQTTFTITGPNDVQNGGFESSSSVWSQGGSSGGGDAHNHSQDVPAHSGSYVGEVDSTSITGNGAQFASLTQTLSPAVLVSSIPNQAGTLTAWIYNNGPAKNGYYAVEITLSAVSGGTTYTLHYYYHSSTLTVPSDTATDKYIDMGPLPNALPVGQWTSLSRNLYNDWTSKGLSSAYSISTIQLRSDGYITSGNIQGQEIYFDDVSLQYTS